VSFNQRQYRAVNFGNSVNPLPVIILIIWTHRNLGLTNSSIPGGRHVSSYVLCAVPGECRAVPPLSTTKKGANHRRSFDAAGTKWNLCVAQGLAQSKLLIQFFTFLPESKGFVTLLV